MTGHESLRDLTGRLQSDISIGNLMMNEEDDNPSWPSFLIDLDLAIKEDREKPSGARNKTGTPAFMAIRALYGEKRSFMDDLESIFWLLFWVCIHYTRPNGESRVVPKFDKWNYADTEELAKIKEGTVAREEVFNKTMESFTPYFQPFVPLMQKLRRVVFPMGKPWEKEDRRLYSQMREILREAMDDEGVKAEWMG
jgi:hypothetical protein